MDKSAIKQIQDTAHIKETLKHLNEVESHIPVAFVPENYDMKDMEKFQEYLSRYRMKYQTNSISDFIEYGKDYAQDGGTCFVDAEGMSASTIFDLGTVEQPLHKAHRSNLELNRTAAYTALLRIDGSHLDQKSASTFIEDWADNIKVTDNSGNKMTVQHAANAINNLTIDMAKSLTSNIDDYGHNLSTMEKIEAANKEAQPSLIEFTCTPYLHFEERTFTLRYQILTAGREPGISMRIVKLEQEQENIAEEFKAKLCNSLEETFLKVYMGKAA